jgi:hypothetical protein
VRRFRDYVATLWCKVTPDGIRDLVVTFYQAARIFLEAGTFSAFKATDDRAKRTLDLDGKH